MASLLDACNETLKRVQIIDSDSELTILSKDGRQNDIDIVIQIWNELMDQLYSEARQPMPNIMSEGTLTLVQDDRDYALNSDLVRLHFPLQDIDNGQYIVHYPGGYLKLLEDEPEPSNFTGLPQAGAIRPDDGELYLDRVPTSDEDGRTYTYRYEKDAELTVPEDTFPFNDAIFRALVPAAAELWKRERKGEFASGVFRTHMGRARRLLSQIYPRGRWTPVSVGENPTDPFEDA